MLSQNQKTIQKSIKNIPNLDIFNFCQMDKNRNHLILILHFMMELSIKTTGESRNYCSNGKMTFGFY